MRIRWKNEAKRKGCWQVRLHKHMQPATWDFRTEHLLHIVQCWKQYFVPHFLRRQFIFTWKEPCPVNIEVQTIGWWDVFVGLKTDTRLILAICSNPAQA